MKNIGVLTLAIFLIGMVSAAHWIVGYTENGQDGTEVDGKRVIIWNPSNGENLTSIIGPSGPSGSSKTYMIDCEMLPSSCSINDLLYVRILEDEDNRIGLNIEGVTVTGNGYDVVANNLTINTPPNVTNEFPENNGNISGTVSFNCSATDLDSNLDTLYLYGNWSGWHLNDSSLVSGGMDSAIFSKYLPEGTYEYSCRAKDNVEIYSEDDYNTTFFVDHTNPVINIISYNETVICGVPKSVRVSCNTFDAFTGVRNVSISVNGVNYVADYLSGDTYYIDALLDSYGDWEFSCYSQDWAGNIANLDGDNITARTGGADFKVSLINTSNEDPIENENVKINATVTNEGCASGEGVLIGLFDGDPESSGINLEEQTISLASGASEFVLFTWIAEIGPTNLFVKADSNNSFVEFSETDNTLNNTIVVDSWQEFYGNVSADKVVGYDVNNMSIWSGSKPISGNIFITDKESNINWKRLQAIGKTTMGTPSAGDFIEIDNALGTGDLDDSVSNVFESYATKNFFIHQEIIGNVPVINSSESSSFKTGILWDMGDDTNGEYDGIDGEDIVFVVEVNNSGQGAYGSYDYEIKIPVRLRELDPTDNKEIYFYYDLN